MAALDIKTGLELQIAYRETIVCASSDGSTAAAGGTGGECYVLNAESGKVIEWPHARRGAQWVFPLPDGRIVLVPHQPRDYTIKIWGAATHSPSPQEVPVPEGWRAAAIDPGRMHLAVGTHGNRFQVVDLKNLSMIKDMHTDTSIFRLEYDQAGTQLAISQEDGTVSLIDPLTFRPGSTLGEPAGDAAWFPAFSPDGTMVAYSLNGKPGDIPAKVVVRDRSTGAVRYALEAFNDRKGEISGSTSLTRSAMSPVSQILACAYSKLHWNICCYDH